MAEEDNDQKTEAPSGKRLEQAREQGNLPISREVASWVMFVSILMVVAWLGPPMTKKLVAILRVFIEMPHAIDLEDRGLQTIIASTLSKVALATCAVFALLLFGAVVGTVAQTGLFASLERLIPDISRLSPARGFNRLFSTHGLIELGKSFAKLIIFGYMVFLTLMPVVADLPAITGHSLMDVLAYMHDRAIHLLVMMLLVFTVVAVADLLFQRFDYIKNLRMTKTEVKDEYKQQEGDPAIKGRLRQIRLEKARRRMMAQVPKADVIVTNPTHFAVALQYDGKKMKAPMVLAKGTDKIAERIRELAEEHKIPLVSNPPLARALYDTVEIDQEIPTQHYRAVAEIISYVYKLRKRRL